MIQEAIIRYLRKHRQESLSPKAVLFDMDGVLYDSMRFHARAWHEVATLHQLTSRPEDFYMFEGRTGESTINELYQRTFQRGATAEEKQTIYKEKADLFNTYNDGAPRDRRRRGSKRSGSIWTATIGCHRFRPT